MAHPSLDRLLDALDNRLARQTSNRLASYRVPGYWVNPHGRPAERTVTPEAFFVESIARLLSAPPIPATDGHTTPGDWGGQAVAYNLFVRAGAAWDHNGDGDIDTQPNAAGWRETGTLLKAITLLPFIRSLGCNTIHLLPVTAIGRDGNKGDLGSPFAIRDPYALDEMLGEPALGLDVSVQFAAFVEAAHHLGIRVVVEFVFRTAAKDAVWAAEHPEWFYWIRAGTRDRIPGELCADAYGAPLWTPEELERVYRKVGTGEYIDLLPPHEVYRRMFLPPPRPEDVRLENGAWRATVVDPATGQIETARIPGAFSDWPPDSDQPPWSDVTYVRLYDHPDFNYIAYNTVRMYEHRLAQPGNAVESLWEKITEVVPHYQRAYNVDGVMIDMGHALPPALKQRIVARARDIHPDFALWAEDFQLKPSARAEGYNVCLGPFMQTVRDRAKLGRWLDTLSNTGVPVPFMANAENHNVPRAVTWPGGLSYARYAQAIGAFLPGVPYIHGGMEVAETRPVNTGFDFTEEERRALPAERLYLFSAGSYTWTREPNLVESLRRLHAVRQNYVGLVGDPSPQVIAVPDVGNPIVVCFVRGRALGPRLLIAGNSDMAAEQVAYLPVGPSGTKAVELLSGRSDAVRDGIISLRLAPGEVVVYKLAASG
jgi:starch synthase (maltosyl-transferring)